MGERIRLDDADHEVISAYQIKPRLIALGQCAHLFMYSSWVIVQRALDKAEYQAKRGY